MKNQLEPRNQDPQEQDGLQARIHDPMWMLTRQWQIGEFKADDAGSPVGARLEFESSLLTRYRPGLASGGAAVQNYAVDKAPLETLVKSETIDPLPNHNLRFSAHAGLHFSRLLKLHGVAQYSPAFLTSFSLKAPTVVEQASLDAGTLNFLSVMAGRGLDGAALYAKLAPGRQGNSVVLPVDPPFNAVQPAERAAMIQSVTEWLNWYDGLFDQPKLNGSAWVKPRMEYTFAVSCNTSRGELALAGQEYTGDRLDWYSCNVDSTQSLSVVANATTTLSTFLPAPVTFRGMPAIRYWELEDGTVNLANIQAAPQDLARTLLLTFALEFGNDWFLVPIDVPVGSVSLVDSLVVTNSFGEKLLLRHTTAVDGTSPTWRMFGLSTEPTSGTPAIDSKYLDAFLLAPALSLTLDGAPVEDVLLLRDEMASLAWAIERTAESPSGQRLNRHEEYAQKQQDQTTSQPAGGTQATTQANLIYRLGTSVPDFWIPFLPVQSGQSVQLRRGSLPGSQPGGGSQPLGRILDPGNELLLQDEEIPREGVRATRCYQLARWSDGSTHLWVGRRKMPGGGEGSSGLRFDIFNPS